MKKSLYSFVILGVFTLLPIKNIDNKTFPQFLQEKICLNSLSLSDNISKLKNKFSVNSHTYIVSEDKCKTFHSYDKNRCYDILHKK